MSWPSSMLLRRTAPEESIVGIVLAGVSLIVMSWLGFAKKKLYFCYNQKQLKPRALRAGVNNGLFRVPWGPHDHAATIVPLNGEQLVSHLYSGDGIEPEIAVKRTAC